MSKRNAKLSIPEPREELYALTQTVKALKEQVEVLSGVRGNSINHAATFRDLLDYNLLKAVTEKGTNNNAYYNPFSGADYFPDFRAEPSAIVSVGAGGDFKTLTDACTYLGNKFRRYIYSGVQAQVVFKSGFTYSEQFVAYGDYLGWITVTSEDAVVLCNRSALVYKANESNFATNAMLASHRFAFFGYNNAILPRLGVLFEMDTSGTAASNYVGILLHGRAGMNMLEGAGFTNVVKPGATYDGRGINVSHGSFVTGWGTIWSGCNIGIRVSNASKASFRESVATGCDIALDVNGASEVGCQDSNYSGATSQAILAKGASRVKAESTNCTGCGTAGSSVDYVAVYAETGAEIELSNGDVSNSGRGIQCESGGKVHFIGGTCAGTNGNGLTARGAGSAIIARDGATITTTGSGGAVVSYPGAMIDVSNSNVTGNTAVSGIYAYGGVVIANNATVTGNAGGSGSSGTDRDIRIRDNGQVFAFGAATSNGSGSVALADTSVPMANALTDDGALFCSLPPAVIIGSGTPEGSVTAPVGHLYLRTNGGASTTLYIKESGTGNTGWVAAAAGSFAAATHTHGIADINATGSPSASTFLRGDGSWASPAGGASQLVVPVHAAADSNVTMTNQANSEQFLGNSNRNILKIDLTNYSQVRLVARVVTASASANSPRIYAEYHTSYTTTVGTYSDIGTSAVTCSLSSAGYVDSGWVDLAAGAKAEVYVTVLQNGGDATADPAVAAVYLHFK